MIRQFKWMVFGMACLSVGWSLRAADLNLVGREMVRLLQDRHYARLPFNEDLSARFFERYFATLDPERLYFLENEVAAFRQRYGRRLHDLVSTSQSMPVAREIFEFYRRRVLSRANFSKRYLSSGRFELNDDREVLPDRTGIKWEPDVRALRQVWKERVELLVLEERLRRRLLQHRAEKEGRPDPFEGAKSVSDSLKLRFERLRKTVREIKDEDIANYFFSAIARSYDPHSDYFSETEMAQFRVDVSNEMVGIGARLAINPDGEFEVEDLVIGGPADREGSLRPGDRVIAISSKNDGNWIDIRHRSLDKVIDLILGDEGAGVGLRILRNLDGGDRILEIVVPRGVVTMKDELARARIIDDGSTKVAVLVIPSFYFDFGGKNANRVSDHVDQLLRRLESEGVAGLVLDVRDNPGGSLQEAQRVTGFFIGEGPVVQVRSSRGLVESLDSPRPEALYQGPVVVMTNRESASAAEIFAGAMQDYRRAVIVGSPSTFGKGTVQRTQDLSRIMSVYSDRENAGWLKLTVQKYYRVSGSSVQIKGVVPDLILPERPANGTSGEAARQHVLPHDVIGASVEYRPPERSALFLPVLKKRSDDRVGSEAYFKGISRDQGAARKSSQNPMVSLNFEKRLAEALASEAQRRSEREARTRYLDLLAKEDEQTLKVYRLTLDDLAKVNLPIYEREDRLEEGNRQGESDSLDGEPEWPSGLDAGTRESLQVLRDLLQLTSDEELAGAGE